MQIDLFVVYSQASDQLFRFTSTHEVPGKNPWYIKILDLLENWIDGLAASTSLQPDEKKSGDL